MMMTERPILERAFELARSGAFTDVKSLDKALAAEGYARGDPHTHSPTARKQLRRLCREAKARRIKAEFANDVPIAPPAAVVAQFGAEARI
jgi:hypothetical protein